MSNIPEQPDSMPYIPPADAPQWFRENLQQQGESHRCQLKGQAVHYLTWNFEASDLPILMLVHGFSGHAHWWSFLAPFFTDRYRVLAIDLPGMGDSTPPPDYHDNCFAEAILGVIDVLDLPPLTIIGHSFGGVQAVRSMALRPGAFTHGIVVDSLIGELPGLPKRLIDAREQHRARASRAECMARFRLTPPQPGAIEAVVSYIGYYSCKNSDNGWLWKFDPGLRNYGEINTLNFLKAVPVRVDCVYGEKSMFNSDDLPTRVLNAFPGGERLIVIPRGHHHLMADKPLELVAALNQLLDTQLC